MKVKQEDIAELQEMIIDKHCETRCWVKHHTDKIEEIEKQLDALCHYLEVKMEYNDEPYYKITSLGEEDK